MPARKSQYQIWYEQVKRELLVTEPQNILARSECCQNIINECVTRMNMNLGLPTLQFPQQYISNVAPRQHLKFLLNWPGLRVDNSPKAPKTKKEYEKKSKNWLNGRRAPNYGKTLFPFFISEAEKHISETGKILIADNEEKGKLYYDIVIYEVLAQLCRCSVSLHEQAKKAPFFCKNSVERKGRLKEILQSYAEDHEYIQGFPSCFEEAIGYFERKSNLYFHRYKKQYLGYNNININNDDETIHCNTNTNTNTSSTSKKERDCKSADAEYWKKQFLNLKRELSAERRMRMNAERERDNLKNMNSNAHINRRNLNYNALLHENCYDNINGSLSTTSSSPRHNNHSFDAHPPHSIHSMNTNDMNRYGPAMPNYCNPHGNMNNVLNQSYQTSFSVLNHMNINNNRRPIQPQPQPQQQQQPLPPLNSSMFEPSLNEMASNDAFSSMIDSMPMMTGPRLSNDSFFALHDDTNNYNRSMPMFSFSK